MIGNALAHALLPSLRASTEGSDPNGAFPWKRASVHQTQKGAKSVLRRFPKRGFEIFESVPKAVTYDFRRRPLECAGEKYGRHMLKYTA